MTYYIAIDIGGTRTRAAIYENVGNAPIKLSRISTQSQISPKLNWLSDLISGIWPSVGDVSAIGMAVAGPLNPHTGVLFSSPNIPGWNNLYLREYIEKQFNVPVMIGNDANLAALGEWKYGSGQGHRSVLYLTVSTGIGGGVIIDNQLLLGNHGLDA